MLLALKDGTATGHGEKRIETNRIQMLGDMYVSACIGLHRVKTTNLPKDHKVRQNLCIPDSTIRLE